ncbi:unnamed protein product [Rotaria sp. Silwood1]|nr:unnamed protein product [Rotaria sp. Silwood1]
MYPQEPDDPPITQVLPITTQKTTMSTPTVTSTNIINKREYELSDISEDELIEKLKPHFNKTETTSIMENDEPPALIITTTHIIKIRTTTPQEYEIKMETEASLGFSTPFKTSKELSKLLLPLVKSRLEQQKYLHQYIRDTADEQTCLSGKRHRLKTYSNLIFNNKQQTSMNIKLLKRKNETLLKDTENHEQRLAEHLNNECILYLIIVI